MIVLWVFILLVSVQKCASEKDFSKKINAEAYLYPDHFWQLDYSTDVEDVLENDSPTVHGDESLTIAGEGRGFLKYKASVSSATLSTYESLCFRDISKCSSGVTYAFWFLLERVVTSHEGSYHLLSLKPKGYGFQDSRMRVLFNIEKGHLKLKVLSTSVTIQSTETLITAAQWYHLMIEEKMEEGQNRINVYINMQPLNKSEAAGNLKLIQPREVDFFLGKAVDENISNAFKNAEVCIDNLAIWKRILDKKEKTKIYFAEFGKIGDVQLSGNLAKPFEIKWSTAYDYYSQVESYTIKWWSGNGTVYKILYPMKPNYHHDKEITAYLEIFLSGKEYTVHVEADLIDAGVDNPFVQGTFTINSKIKGSQVLAYSDTTTSIKLSWKVGLSNPNMSVYVITHNETGKALEERPITTTSLEYVLEGLMPYTIYNVKMTKEDFETKYQVTVTDNIKTLPIVETLDSSIASASILNFTSTSVYLDLALFPKLWKYNLVYNITTCELHNPKSPVRSVIWDLQAQHVYLDVVRLKAMATYSVDVEMKDAGYQGDGVSMKAPLVFRIKDFYKPPTEIRLVRSSESSLTVCLVWPTEVINNNHVITHVNLHVTDGKERNDVISFMLDHTDKVINGLDQFTEYRVFGACGDGKTFGEISKLFQFRTTDVDECRNATICGIDSQRKKCVNTVGSFVCSCKHGFIMEGSECIDIDECKNTMACGKHALKKCVNTEGSFNCHCNDGYEKDVHGCSDINECANKTACGQDGELKLCLNNDGSFKCLCQNGYMMDGDLCKDIDECKNTTVCGKDSILKQCVNMKGSFNCSCKSGYVKLGDRCLVDVVISPCRREVSRNIIWPETFHEETVTAPCPVGASGNASRSCKELVDQILHWEKLDLSSCVSQRWNNIVKLRDERNSINKVVNKLKRFVEEEPLYGGDITNIVNMIGSLVNEGKKDENNFTEVVIDVTSKLLDEKMRGAWNDLPQEKRSKDAGKLLETTDALIKTAAKQSKDDEKSVRTQNVEIKLQQISEKDKRVLNYFVGGNSVTIPTDAVELDQEPVVVAVVFYQGLSELIGVPSNTRLITNSSGFIINSEVTSVSLFPQLRKRFEKPVVIVLTLSQKVYNQTPHCTFWDKDANRWSDKGCGVFSSNESHVTCNCYHLTSFVVLMTVSDAHTNVEESHRFSLGLITTIGIGISLLGLLASFLTFIFVRVIRSIRNTIHQHLVIALFIAQLLFLFGIERTELHIGCQVIAAVIHYFFLVAFFIMGLEGIVLYFMLVRVYRSMGTSGYGSVKYVIWCWVLPVIFILVNLIIDDEAYQSHSRYCWLSLHNGYIWSFVGPVLLIILCNFFILCMTLRVMTEKAKKRTSAVDEIWFWMKGSCLLLSILGVTWVLGIFYVDQQTLFIAYLFNIVNSLQGTSIFLFHCICDPRVRKAYQQFFCCARKQEPRFRANTRSTRMFSNASKASIKTKKKMSYSNGTSPAEASLMSSPGGTSSTANDSLGVLVGATKL